jgi:hypothetical protein
MRSQMRDGIRAGQRIAAAAALAAIWSARGLAQEPARITVKSPVVTLVGCATTTVEPHIWALTHAGNPEPSPTVGFTSGEGNTLTKRSLGSATYQLIGVADFVDVETARRIGVRGKLLASSRMNTTGMLATGHKVAVKGLYIEGKPARINLTSVIDLGSACP